MNDALSACAARTGECVPPAEFDPVTYERLTEIVPVASVGTVVSWTWQPAPLEGQPLDRPFAWALIKLDGADTPLLRGRCRNADAISTGTRVHVHWVDEPVGAITDIAYFAGRHRGGRRVDDRRPRPGHHARHADQHRDPAHASLERAPSCAGSRKASCSARGRENGKVYFPATGPTPPPADRPEFVELPDKGTVTTFAIINIPFAGQRIKPPYVAAYVLLDGADIPFLHLITEIDASEVRMGMRVEAVEAPRGMGWASTTSTTSGPPANRTPTTTPTSTTCRGIDSD